ncbi:MAG: MlaE family lipid ABC transporter permease subunit [Bdellovibrionota bacterium]|nr:MAG: MlaE family lipid ABC transporter permease subunit [Bdellovibrionota bacterium]
MPFVAATESIGRHVMDVSENWGRSCIFLFRTLGQAVRPPYQFHLFIAQLLHIGANSTLVIALIGLFTGAVLAVQGEYTLAKFGATAYVGSAVALSLIRELGPVLTALMVIGRAGSAITAEIGIMRITEQIDALRSMAVDPLKYLMVPRLLAGIIAVPLLTGMFITVGIFGGYAVAVGLLGLSSGTFMTQMISAVSSLDVYSGFIKAVVFGFIFGWVACYKGYTCGFGAVGVNRATTQSVVTASVAVLVVDYFLTSILTRVFME